MQPIVYKIRILGIKMSAHQFWLPNSAWVTAQCASFSEQLSKQRTGKHRIPCWLVREMSFFPNANRGWGRPRAAAISVIRSRLDAKDGVDFPREITLADLIVGELGEYSGHSLEDQGSWIFGP